MKAIILAVILFAMSCASSGERVPYEVKSKDNSVKLHAVSAFRNTQGLIISGHIDGIHRLTDKAEVKFFIYQENGELLHKCSKVYAGRTHSTKKENIFRHAIERVFEGKIKVIIELRKI